MPFEQKIRFGFYAALVLTILLIILLFMRYINEDTVNVTQSSGNEIGLMVDGQDINGFVNDKKFISNNTNINVGKLKLATESNEVVGFTNDRPPTYLNTPWKDGNDNFNLRFPSKIQIPVTVWIVQGPFEDPDPKKSQKQHAIEAQISTSEIWYNERMGVAFGRFNIIDATNPSKYPKAHYHFAFGDANNGVSDIEWQQLRDDIGFVDGQINVYWVNTVEGDTSNGIINFKDNKDKIVMGRNTPDDVLVHEVGHAFSLRHINLHSHDNDSNAEFNQENVMQGDSPPETRKYFTEGQLFRAHMQPDSSLNCLYKILSPERIRSCCNHPLDCDVIAATASCPALQKRIWADGILRPN